MKTALKQLGIITATYSLFCISILSITAVLFYGGWYISDHFIPQYEKELIWVGMGVDFLLFVYIMTHVERINEKLFKKYAPFPEGF